MQSTDGQVKIPQLSAELQFAALSMAHHHLYMYCFCKPVLGQGFPLKSEARPIDQRSKALNKDLISFVERLLCVC